MATRPRPDSLRHYDDPHLYEATFRSRRHDVRYFADLAEEIGGPVLEYGCGTGRVTLPLAGRGTEVVAMDASPTMLEVLQARAAKKRAAVEIVRGDMRKKRLNRRFPLILATFNVVGHLRGRKDFAPFLARVREHLTPGGLLVFDFPLPHPAEVEAEPGEAFPAPRFKHPKTKQWVRQTERFFYDVTLQELCIESDFSTLGARDVVTVPLVLRQWFPREMEALLTYEGFDVELFADYTDLPIAMAEDMIVVHARRSRRRRPPRN